MLSSFKYERGVSMNFDNRRLREIQLELKIYMRLCETSDCMYDIFKYQEKINKLETEEREILKRCDVII